MILAPIVLFIYNRPSHTRKTLEVLSRNILADQSELFIFADGPKDNATEEQLKKIKQTRLVAHEQKWCKEVNIIESDFNKGLATSIIDGVTKIVNKYGKVIVLEDDIITSKFFLSYMNDSLNTYENEKKVWHITGWRDPVKNSKKTESFFYPVMDCWSWATWADRWQYYRKDCDFYINTFTEKMIFDFNICGSESGMWNQILQNKNKQINTWAIFWYATIFINNGLCLAPTKSLVLNIGFDNTGIHCGQTDEYNSMSLNENKILLFPNNITINEKEYKKKISYFRTKYKVSFHKQVSSKILFFSKFILTKLGLYEKVKSWIKK